MKRPLSNLWWEYSNNNKIHLLQEKLFHCCVSCQLPQRPDLSLPGLRNEWLAMSFFSETLQTSFSDPHASEKAMWKQQYFISQGMGVLMLHTKKSIATYSPQNSGLCKMSRPVAVKENCAVEVEENRYVLLFIIQDSASKLLLPWFEDNAHLVPGTVVKGQMLFTGI